MRLLDRFESKAAADCQLERAIEQRREDIVSTGADSCRIVEVIREPRACEEQRARFTKLDRVEIAYRSRHAPVIDTSPRRRVARKLSRSVAFPIESKTTSTPAP